MQIKKKDSKVQGGQHFSLEPKMWFGFFFWCILFTSWRGHIFNILKQGFPNFCYSPILYHNQVNPPPIPHTFVKKKKKCNKRSYEVSMFTHAQMTKTQKTLQTAITFFLILDTL